MYLIVGETTSPYFNLAFEEYALTQMRESMIALWRNDASVIVGSNQNTLEEIDIDFVRARNIPVVRRQSGGGAVFHDLGNVNYTIVHEMADGDFGNYEKFAAPLIGYLATLGVAAEFEGRNDLVAGGRKFCGNAQAVKDGRIMHHGCILYSSDLSNLAGALSPRPAKIESKGVKSVRKRVTNIADHLDDAPPVRQFLRGLADYLLAHLEDIHPYTLTEADIAATERLMREKYETWAWNFGRSPAYHFEKSHPFDFGLVEVKLAVERGIICEVSIFGDFFGVREKGELESRLRGVRHERQSICESLADCEIGEYIAGMNIEQFMGLVC